MISCVLAKTSPRWKGLPESARSGLGALQREKHDLERSLDKKKDQLSELLVQQIAFRNLARRNRLQSAPRAAGGEGAAKDAEDLAASKVGRHRLRLSSVEYEGVFYRPLLEKILSAP